MADLQVLMKGEVGPGNALGETCRESSNQGRLSGDAIISLPNVVTRAGEGFGQQKRLLPQGSAAIPSGVSPRARADGKHVLRGPGLNPRGEMPEP